MRKRIGFIFCMSGVLLLLNPSLEINDFVLVFNYIFVHYWPIGLIMIGLSLINQKNKPRRNKN